MWYQRGYLCRENGNPNTIFYYNGQEYGQYLSHTDNSYYDNFWNSIAFLKRQLYSYIILPFKINI